MMMVLMYHVLIYQILLLTSYYIMSFMYRNMSVCIPIYSIKYWRFAFYFCLFPVQDQKSTLFLRARGTKRYLSVTVSTMQKSVGFRVHKYTMWPTLWHHGGCASQRPTGRRPHKKSGKSGGLVIWPGKWPPVSSEPTGLVRIWPALGHSFIGA